MSKDGVFSGPYFPVFGINSVFSSNTGLYGPEKTPYLDTFYAVKILRNDKCWHNQFRKASWQICWPQIMQYTMTH